MHVQYFAQINLNPKFWICLPPNSPWPQVIPPGHLVKVKVQLKEGKEPRVMYLLPGDKEDKEVDMQKVVKEIESSGSRRNRIWDNWPQMMHEEASNIL